MNKKEDIVRITHNLAELVYAKGEAYGDTITQAAGIMKMLYPAGIAPEQYRNSLCLVRIIDKLGRIATAYSSETVLEAWKDIAGYAVRMIDLEECNEMQNRSKT